MRTVKVLTDCIDLDILFLFFRNEENDLARRNPLGCISVKFFVHVQPKEF
jgi:hypothetical protein